MLAISIGFAVMALASWHLYLIFTGQTTIEYYSNSDSALFARQRGEMFHNEYDLGSRRNFKLFFSINTTNTWFSILLPIKVHSYGNGIDWLKADSLIRRDIDLDMEVDRAYTMV